MSPLAFRDPRLAAIELSNTVVLETKPEIQR